MDSIPLIVWQSAVAFFVAAVVGLVGVWLYNRREKRRKSVLDIRDFLVEKHVPIAPAVLGMYVYGDYFGLGHIALDVVRMSKDPKAFIDACRKLFWSLFDELVKDPTALTEMQKRIAAATSPPPTP